MQKYLFAKEVCARLGGISDMTLWRWVNDPDLNFPKPVYVRRRRLFKEEELEAWLEQRQRKS